MKTEYLDKVRTIVYVVCKKSVEFRLIKFIFSTESPSITNAVQEEYHSMSTDPFLVPEISTYTNFMNDELAVLLSSDMTPQHAQDVLNEGG